MWLLAAAVLIDNARQVAHRSLRLIRLSGVLRPSPAFTLAFFTVIGQSHIGQRHRSCRCFLTLYGTVCALYLHCLLMTFIGCFLGMTTFVMRLGAHLELLVVTSILHTIRQPKRLVTATCIVILLS